MTELSMSNQAIRDLAHLSSDLPRQDINMIEDVLVSASRSLGKLEAYNSINSLNNDIDTMQGQDSLNAQLLADILDRSDMLLSEFKETGQIIDQAHLAGWSQVMTADHNGQQIDIEDIRAESLKVVSDAFNMEDQLPFFADIKFASAEKDYADDPFAGLDYETGRPLVEKDTEDRFDFDNGL